jgi:hypothetical protein
MVWFFERGAEAAEVEARRLPTHFEVVVRRPDGPESVQIARAASELLQQLEAAPRRLLQEGWKPRPLDPLQAMGVPAPRAGSLRRRVR